jgi:hypothetical protein
VDTDTFFDRFLEAQQQRVVKRIRKSRDRIRQARQAANQATVDSYKDELGCRTHASGKRRQTLSEIEGDGE